MSISLPTYSRLELPLLGRWERVRAIIATGLPAAKRRAPPPFRGVGDGPAAPPDRPSRRVAQSVLLGDRGGGVGLLARIRRASAPFLPRRPVVPVEPHPPEGDRRGRRLR